MDVKLTEEQEMLKRASRDYFNEKCPAKLVKEMAGDEKGYVPRMWQEIAEMGWLGLIFPEKYGGAGMNFSDLAVLVEEMGRICFPGPFIPTVILGGLSILQSGTEEQKNRYLPEIAGGKAIWTMALLEPDRNRYEAGSVQIKAADKGEDFILNGTKMFVPDAHVADYILCVARTKDSTDKEDGVTVFIVDAHAPGISTTVLNTMAGDKQCKVNFNNVKISKENILGEIDRGWNEVRKILEQAAVVKCCEMVGGMRAVMAMTIEYVNTRMQFGVHIGSFQAVQWHCVDIAVNVESSSIITAEAVWKISKGYPYSGEAAMAKAWVGEAYEKVVTLATQAHGGVSIIEDHNLPLYFKRAPGANMFCGDTRFYLETVAQNLGLKIS
jgi:alkylation response protein AidB-like acyl-CoA dehydrogenase